ncbi:hypothetical protein PG987_001880 [Apiospora arundinis]
MGNLMVLPVSVPLLAHNLSHTGDDIQSEWDECASALFRDVCRRETGKHRPCGILHGRPCHRVNHPAAHHQARYGHVAVQDGNLAACPALQRFIVQLREVQTRKAPAALSTAQ